MTIVSRTVDRGLCVSAAGTPTHWARILNTWESKLWMPADCTKREKNNPRQGSEEHALRASS